MSDESLMLYGPECNQCGKIVFQGIRQYHLPPGTRDKICHCTTVVNMRWSNFDVRIDRRTKWGNPFSIGKDGSREEVVARYAKWILTQQHLLDSLNELFGKRLGCWCAPQLCHGDVLVALVEQQFSHGRKIE